MATLKDYRDERLRKLAELKQLGINPYPAQSKRTHTLAQVTGDFEALQGQEVSVVGRVQNIRKFGKIAFLVIKDASGSLQLFLRSDAVVPLDAGAGRLGIDQLPLLDSGDFVQATGVVERTQTGEMSVTVHELKLLGKTLRPMPSQQEGFTNKEERFRRRYVDMNVNEDVRQRFVRRSKFWQATRDFLNQRGFTEVNIPVLEHTTGGADANPFVTHMDALDQDFYLRISHELPLKRLVGAGFEKVYDIGPRFRNENYSDEHLPEHVAMEWYWAYADWQAGMQFQEDLFKYILQETFGRLQFQLGRFEVDLAKDWERWDYAETIQKHYGLDPFNCTLEQVQRALAEHHLEVEQTENLPRGIDKLWKNIRKDVAGPVWLINTPTFISPLSKVNPDRPETTQRAQVVIAGSELCNLFSELNDPLDQLNRFVEQQGMRDAGDAEAMMLDIDFVEMLEYGMPPACGLGFSERVFWIFEGVTAREGVPFPQLRVEVDETTKALYPELYATGHQGAEGATRPQDFSRRIVAVVNKELEPWQVVNAVAHMEAIIGNEVPKSQLVSGDFFVASDQIALPRNSQYPIIIMRASEPELHKLYEKVQAAHLKHHVFIKEMQETTDDAEIVDRLRDQAVADTTFYGVSFFAPNGQADDLTKGLQLWK
ncbi:MAG TPA: amino acid--tRNA ligase-related protein [Candidatus Saccharimonadales bacterium]|nr:amino acid--tRNA ligase-related protein [Candidatus Saccharimonadales bacterium]